MSIFAYLYASHMKRVERKIGYQVRFSNIPKSWINGWMTFDIEKSWAKYGIKAWGVDYFTIGSLTKDGISLRFVRNEKQYQSWLGAYLVKFKEQRDFTIQDHFNLAVADQKNWLQDFGDPHPYDEMPAQNIIHSEAMVIGEYTGTLYEYGGGPSHSDVGSRSNNIRNRILMSFMASMFNLSNPSLHLTGANFIPKVIPTEYENAILKGYVAIIDLERDTKVVLYGNGTVLLNPDGSELQDYTPLLKQDILAAFKGVVITKI